MSEEPQLPLDPSEKKNRDSNRKDEEPQLESVFKKLADKQPEKFMELSMGITQTGNPLVHKMDAEHISSILDLAEKHDGREFSLHAAAEQNNKEENSSKRRYALCIFMTFIALFVFVIVMFKDKPNILTPIISSLVSGAGGFLAGWGFGKKN